VTVEQDFEELFRRQFPRLVAFGIAMSGSTEVAHDLAQETMSRAHQQWASVSLTDSPEAWLRRVMRNLLVDHHRRAGVERRALERLSRRPHTPAPVAGESRLAEWLDVLPERQRAAVALFYVDDLSIAEIASVLSVAPGTVKATLWKARRSLRRHLSKEATDD
jgi:RNA polymerase sigma-70 factor, ECF subfamily